MTGSTLLQAFAGAAFYRIALCDCNGLGNEEVTEKWVIVLPEKSTVNT